MDEIKVWEAGGITVHCVTTGDPANQARPHVSYRVSDSNSGQVINEVDSLAEVARLLELLRDSADEGIPVAPG